MNCLLPVTSWHRTHDPLPRGKVANEHHTQNPAGSARCQIQMMLIVNKSLKSVFPNSRWLHRTCGVTLFVLVSVLPLGQETHKIRIYSPSSKNFPNIVHPIMEQKMYYLVDHERHKFFGICLISLWFILDWGKVLQNVFHVFVKIRKHFRFF